MNTLQVGDPVCHIDIPIRGVVVRVDDDTTRRPRIVAILSTGVRVADLPQKWRHAPDGCEACGELRSDDPDFCPACLHAMATHRKEVTGTD